MNTLISYIVGSYNELRYKVSWPTWSELQSSAIVVFISALIFSLIIALMDIVFGANQEGSIFFGYKGVIGYLYDFIRNLF